jgi:hypothetical protein
MTTTKTNDIAKEEHSCARCESSMFAQFHYLNPPPLPHRVVYFPLMRAPIFIHRAPHTGPYLKNVYIMRALLPYYFPDAVLLSSCSSDLLVFKQ